MTSMILTSSEVDDCSRLLTSNARRLVCIVCVCVCPLFRYIVIVHPLKSRTWCSAGRIHKIIGAVWIASLLLSSPILYVMDTTKAVFYNNETYHVVVSCLDSKHATDDGRIAFAWYQLSVVFLLPVVTIIYCYAFVITVLWLSTKRLARLTQADSHSDDSVCVHRLMSTCGDTQRLSTASRSFVGSGRRRSSTAAINTRGRVRLSGGRDHSADVVEARKQVIRMLLAIITVFFCCWGPKWILFVLKRHNLEALHTDVAFCVMLIIHLLPYIQSCVNPIIYSFMSHNFRRTVATLWRRLFSKCRYHHRRGAGAGFGIGGVGGAFSATGNGCGGAQSDEWKFVEMAMDTRTASLASHVTADVRLTTIRASSLVVK